MTSSVVPWEDYGGSQAEELIAAWLVRSVPGAQRIDGAGGDDGADVRAPVAGGRHIYEIKSFYKRLSAGQKTKVRNSLLTAAERQSDMVRWTLVLPLNLSPAEIRWFENVLGPLVRVPIDWIGRTQVETGLSEHRDLLRAFAPGSTERRAMDLLGEYHAESAAMSRGMVDGIERLNRLKSQFDLTDPNWSFDVHAQREKITVDIRPKDEEEARRNPLKFSLEVSSPDDSPTGRAMGEFLRYGRPADIPSEEIKRFDIDLPGNLNELLSQQRLHAVSIVKNDEEKSWRLQQRILALREGRIVATLPVEWDDRSRGPLGGAWLSGRDRSGFLRVVMRVEPDQGGGLEIQAPASDDVLPEEALPVLRFLTMLKNADHLRLEAPGYPVTEVRITGDIVGRPEVPKYAIVVAETLARIQANAGIAFPLPRRWSTHDGEMMHFCDQLLINGQVQWYWPGYVMHLPAESIRKLLLQATLPRVNMSGRSGDEPCVIDLMGHQVPLSAPLRCEVINLIVVNPRILAAQVAIVRPETPLLVHFGQDNYTRSKFFLEKEDSQESANTSVPDHSPPSAA